MMVGLVSSWRTDESSNFPVMSGKKPNIMIYCIKILSTFICDDKYNMCNKVLL